MSTTPTRIAILIALCLLFALPGVAAADGDPASDYLLAQNVYYPFTPAVSGPLQRALNTETTAAARHGFPIKVALIKTHDDLGAVWMLMGHPQTYARFLEREIDFNAEQPLLVVMADGYGVQGLPGPSMAAAARLRPPRGSTSDDLASAALAAVTDLAAADGHRIPSAAGAAVASESNTPPVLVWLLAASATLAGAILYARRRRTGRAPRHPRHRR